MLVAGHLPYPLLQNLVPPPGIEPGSTVLQTGAMTTSAKAALIGVLDGERSHTIAFTEQCADHYTTNTIDGRGNWIRTSDHDFKDHCFRPD